MTHLKRTTQAVCASALIALIAGCSDNSSVPVAISDSSAGAKSAQEDSGLPQMTMTGKRAMMTMAAREMMTTTMTARGKKMPTGTPAPVKVEQSK